MLVGNVRANEFKVWSCSKTHGTTLCELICCQSHGALVLRCEDVIFLYRIIKLKCYQLLAGNIPLNTPLRVTLSSKNVSILVLWKLCMKGSKSTRESPQALSVFTVGHSWAPEDFSVRCAKVYETKSVHITTRSIMLAKICSGKLFQIGK